MFKVNLERLDDFCEAWIAKANRADTTSIDGVFDQFFSLWLVYNRLYEEAGRILVHERHPWSQAPGFNKRPPFMPMPDRQAAITGITFFCGASALKSAIAKSCDSQALDRTLRAIESGQFFLHENYATGEPDHEKDQALVRQAREGDAEALLALVYKARCNLFHGQKAYSEIQRPLLGGMIAVLVVVIEQARAKMRSRMERLR
ncbi:hypothetical protein [Castellaniella sp.]|uniref:hypothetical protein n=1 Tax=Castellaniella sp. TaxID=1955812 RepID=UPI002AFE9F12|nr:hypothetical protein [Castellaniella sp.]